ncbi:hypothetical protein BD770DRAFT_382171 [Pilaira anomala]|nr:hypothetical protein BD770DRAFT_382171 [Pilaira anomala]
MQTLPFEILKLTFKYLSKEEVLQCQLTSKTWYDASVELLYSVVEIKTKEKALQYIRSISNSPRLGSSLRVISALNMIQQDYEGVYWDENNLLNAILRHCPNVLNLQGIYPDLSFWVRVSHAANLGQLSRLQVFPDPKGDNLESYMHTVLLFKNSLIRLALQNEYGLDESGFSQLKVYQTLKDQLSEFKNLKILEIEDTTGQRLSHLDKMIDSCLHLENLTVLLYPTNEQDSVFEPETAFIRSHHNIRDIECNWSAISNDNQLKYIMQKFPNLQGLRIYQEYARDPISREGYFSPSVMIDFLRFAIAIPSLYMTMELKKQDLANIWIELMKSSDGLKDVAIKFNPSPVPSNKVELEFMEKRSVIYFPYHVDDVALSTFKFFARAGGKIRSLQILDIYTFIKSARSSPRLMTYLNMGWIFQILQLCPSLQRLKVYSPLYDGTLPSHIVPHLKVKKLYASHVFDSPTHLRFLECMALHLPNLKGLKLAFSNQKHTNVEPLSVLMLKTKLMYLQLDNLPPRYSEQNIFEMYIRLSTDAGVKFYKGAQTGLSTMHEHEYNQSEKRFRFEITCASLDKLVIFDGSINRKKLIEFVV